MAGIELTKAAFEALGREARAQMDTAIGDLDPAKGEEDPMRLRLNACADVLAAIGQAKVGWSLEDPREEDAARAVEFSAEALAFLREQHRATAGYIAEQDVNGEADYGHMGRECFLHHVLNRVLGADTAGTGDSAALDRIAKLLDEHKDWGQVDADAFEELGRIVSATGRPVLAGAVAS